MRTKHQKTSSSFSNAKKTMFTLLFPIADYLPMILRNLDLPEVEYHETKDEASNIDLCTASVYFCKDRTKLRLFCSSSPDGPSSAKHLAAAAVVQHLKQAYCFIIVDGNHRELAELKGAATEPSPLHITQVSPLLDGVQNPESLVEFCVAEQIPCGTSIGYPEPGQNLAAAATLIIASADIPPVANTQVLNIGSPNANPAAKKLKFEVTEGKGKAVKQSCAQQFECYQDMRNMRRRLEQLHRQNAKLHTELIDQKLKCIHSQQSKARFMRAARTFVTFFMNNEAADALHNQIRRAGPEGPAGEDDDR